MRALLKLIRCEFWKIKRKKLFHIAFLTTFIIPVFYSMIIKDANLDNLMSVVQEENGFLVLIPLSIILAASLFFEEQDHDTLKNLLCVPVTRGRLSLAKLFVVLVFDIAYELAGFFRLPAAGAPFRHSPERDRERTSPDNRLRRAALGSFDALPAPCDLVQPILHHLRHHRLRLHDARLYSAYQRRGDPGAAWTEYTYLSPGSRDLPVALSISLPGRRRPCYHNILRKLQPLFRADADGLCHPHGRGTALYNDYDKNI